MIGASAVGSALGGAASRATMGQKTTAGDVAVDAVMGGLAGILGSGYISAKGNIASNGSYYPDRLVSTISNQAKQLLEEYKSNGWQKVTSGSTGEPHAWINSINGKLPSNGKIFDAQYMNGSSRGVERFVLGDNGHLYYSNNHYGASWAQNGEPAFYKLIGWKK